MPLTKQCNKADEAKEVRSIYYLFIIIIQASGAFAQAKNVLCNRKLQAITRTRFYEATVVNLLLLGL